MVEMVADLFGRVNAMIEVGDERGDGALEVDIVLPQRIVCVKEQSLACGQVKCRGICGHKVDYKVEIGREAIMAVGVC
jgi:hypothetical protein